MSEVGAVAQLAEGGEKPWAVYLCSGIVEKSLHETYINKTEQNDNS